MKLKQGFTLVELMVVISITSVMSSIIFPSFNTAREAARDAVRIQDIQQLSIAMELTRDFFTDEYTPLSYTTPYAIGTELPEVPRNNTVNQGIYGWIDNTTNPYQYCAFAKLESDKFGGQYYVAGILGAGFMDVEPTDLKECIFYEENSYDSGLQLEDIDGDPEPDVTPTGPACGDGTVDAGEQCDGANLDSETCATIGGYVSGTLSCSPTCQFNVGSCVLAPQPPVCGNGIIEGSESCDTAALDGAACSDLGFASGTLSCTSSCTYQTAMCSMGGGGGGSDGDDEEDDDDSDDSDGDDGSSDDSSTKPTKTNVCHKDGKNKYKTLNITTKAYNAHISHGDTPGKCPGDR